MYACYMYPINPYTLSSGAAVISPFLPGWTYFQIHESSPRKLLLFIFYTIFRPLHIQNNNNNRNEIIIACSHKIINTYSLNVILLFLPSKFAASAAIANSSYQFCPLNGGQAYFSNWFSTPLLLLATLFAQPATKSKSKTKSESQSELSECCWIFEYICWLFQRT